MNFCGKYFVIFSRNGSFCRAQAPAGRWIRAGSPSGKSKITAHPLTIYLSWKNIRFIKHKICFPQALQNVKVLALYFSAHWCPPCRQFTPLLKQAWNNYAQGSTQKPVSVVFVSSDRSRQEQLSYMREAHGNWPAVPSQSPLSQ